MYRQSLVKLNLAILPHILLIQQNWHRVYSPTVGTPTVATPNKYSPNVSFPDLHRDGRFRGIDGLGMPVRRIHAVPKLPNTSIFTSLTHEEFKAEQKLGFSPEKTRQKPLNYMLL